MTYKLFTFVKLVIFSTVVFFSGSIYSMSCKDRVNPELGDLLKAEETLYEQYVYQTVVPAKYTHSPHKKSKMSDNLFYKLIDKAYENGNNKNTERLYIEGLMADFDLTKFQAVEVQAVLRRYNQNPTDKIFRQAIREVKKGNTLSQLDHKAIKNAEFVVALDLDGTMFDQHSDRKWSKDFHQFSYVFEGSKEKFVATTPGWYMFIEGIRKQGGAVVIYSRNNDDVVHNLASVIKHKGKSLKQMVDGVFSSGHMVLSQNNSVYLGERSANSLAQKDLDLIDTTKTIIIDDEVKYIKQTELTREVEEFSVDQIIPVKPKGKYKSEFSMIDFNGDISFSDTNKQVTSEKPIEPYNAAKDIERFENQFNKILSEIAEALDYAKTNNVNFATAYLTYSSQGQDVIKTITGQSLKWNNPLKQNYTVAEASELIRTQPNIMVKVIKKRKKADLEEDSWYTEY